MGSAPQAYRRSLAYHHSELLKAPRTGKPHSNPSPYAYIITTLKLITETSAIPASPKTTALNQPAQITMPSQTRDYAPSTYSVSTTCSNEKTPQQPTKTKRSFKQTVKNIVKDIGSSPFEYDNREKQSLGWAAQMPPSRL